MRYLILFCSKDVDAQKWDGLKDHDGYWKSGFDLDFQNGTKPAEAAQECLFGNICDRKTDEMSPCKGF